MRTVRYSMRMTNAYTQRLDALHEELAQLYRGKSTDTLRIEGLWARIERLEATAAKLKGFR